MPTWMKYTFWMLFGSWLLCICSGAEAQAACAPLPPDELRDLVSSGLKKLRFDALTEARLLFTHTVERLECLEGVVSPQLLAHVWLGLACVRLRLQDVEGTRVALRRALVLHPGARWSSELGQQGALLLELERIKLQRSTKQHWNPPRLREGETLFLNGERVQRRWGGYWLMPGPQLLQVVVGERVVLTHWWDPTPTYEE
ncbi:MAG: hypothetical protein ACKO6N_14680 [Myxococcota bacterium]